MAHTLPGAPVTDPTVPPGPLACAGHVGLGVLGQSTELGG